MELLRVDFNLSPQGIAFDVSKFIGDVLVTANVVRLSVNCGHALVSIVRPVLFLHDLQSTTAFMGNVHVDVRACARQNLKLARSRAKLRILYRCSIITVNGARDEGRVLRADDPAAFDAQLNRLLFKLTADEMPLRVRETNTDRAVAVPESRHRARFGRITGFERLSWCGAHRDLVVPHPSSCLVPQIYALNLLLRGTSHAILRRTAGKFLRRRRIRNAHLGDKAASVASCSLRSSQGFDPLLVCLLVSDESLGIFEGLCDHVLLRWLYYSLELLQFRPRLIDQV